MAAYFAALDPMTLVRALPGNVAQGIIWGIMALGVYITFRILDFADLTVDGSLATGGAVAVMLIRAGVNPALALVFAFLAGMAAGFVTGVLHTFFGIPGILASILTQIGLYSVNLGIMPWATLPGRARTLVLWENPTRLSTSCSTNWSLLFVM